MRGLLRVELLRSVCVIWKINKTTRVSEIVVITAVCMIKFAKYIGYTWGGTLVKLTSGNNPHSKFKTFHKIILS